MATEASKKLILDIQTLYEDIRITISTAYNMPNDRTIELYINEIIARLFVRVYGDYLFDNIYSYQKRNLREIPESEDDTLENNIRRMRRNEEEQQAALNRFIGYLRLKGYNIPNYVPYKESNSKTIPKDAANLIMIDNMCMHHFNVRDKTEEELQASKNKNRSFKKDQIDTFLDILMRGTVDSHNLTVDTFINSFKQIDDCYEKAKVESNKRNYINKWVDFYRMETRLHISIINKIADYMIENNFKSFANNTDLPHLLWGTIEIENILSEAISVLRYERYIRPYFSGEKLDKLAESAIKSRIEQVVLINLFINKAQEVFEPYFRKDVDEDIIDVIYCFCKEQYPIIESHQPFDFYDSDPKKFSYKVRCLRKIINDLIPPQEIKQYYKPLCASYTENK